MTTSNQDSIQENQLEPILSYSKEDFDLEGKEKCDLIMKGGVASGVLYPATILKLATKYRFHSIGGTSAGAIAAAAAAAAEYGRVTAAQAGQPSQHSGFMKLQGLRDDLLKENFLFNLFQPTASTRPLFNTLIELYSLFQPQNKPSPTNQQSQTSRPVLPIERRAGGWLRRVGQIWSFMRQVFPILQRHNQAAFQKGRFKGLIIGLSLAIFFGLFSGLLFIGARLIGILEGGGHFWLGVLLFGLFWSSLLGLLGWVIGGFSGALYHLSQIFLTKVANGNETLFGICTGSGVDESATAIPSHPSLSNWLTNSLNELAGLPINSDPLTFAQLKAKEIDFRLVTTNLSEGQPYVFPLSNGLHRLIFREADFEKLFPNHVVAYLKKMGGQCIKDKEGRCLEGSRLPEGYYNLPHGDELPVVVATRLSLSFPILLSAVRLYTLKEPVLDNLKEQPRDMQAGDLREQWFSDGGISSNFPIHMFDAWRPTHPTFGIKLYGMLSTDKRDTKGQRMSKDWVRLPRPQEFSNGGEPTWTPIRTLPKFLSAIIDTMQNHRDNMQSILPGYRERIVQIYLAPHEGGLNLKMSHETIKDVVVKGQQAAEALDQFNFGQHQWIRFRVLMAQVENEIARLKKQITEQEKRRCSEGSKSKVALGDLLAVANFRAELGVNRHDQASLALSSTLDSSNLEQALTSSGPNKFSRVLNDYNEIFDLQLNAQEKWYKCRDEAWCKQASKRLEALLNFMEVWEKLSNEGNQGNEGFFNQDAPEPPSVLRVSPDL